MIYEKCFRRADHEISCNYGQTQQMLVLERLFYILPRILAKKWLFEKLSYMEKRILELGDDRILEQIQDIQFLNDKDTRFLL